MPQSSIMDRSPEQIPFPFQFSTPARYHNPSQTFEVGDWVWYEVRILQPTSTSAISWGEGVITQIHSGEKDEKDSSTNMTYTIAGKAWDYDHWTHPYMGQDIPSTAVTGSRSTHQIKGPPQYMNVKDAKEGRALNRQWTQIHHPNSNIRRAALSGEVDQVFHPALAAVPHQALFKVWDRLSVPEKPIPLNVMDGARDDTDREGESFQGAKQMGYGPIYWGITLEQLKAIQTLPNYERDMSMYEVVQAVIKPITKGKSMGYALCLNQEKPLRADQMVSHAWGEKYSDFVEALEASNEKGPFWVCAMSIYQNEDNPNLTISRQLGSNIETGPFATVLKQASTMIAVFTPAMDIYLRMWCVFEIFIATKYNVDVQFASISRQYRSGIENMYDSIFEYGRSRCDCARARCGNPKMKMNDDELKIRALIGSYPGKFELIDSVVEWCKVVYHIRNMQSPGRVFQDEPAHVLLLGGPKRYDFLAKTLSSISVSMDRISIENGSDMGERQSGENMSSDERINMHCCSNGCIIT